MIQFCDLSVIYDQSIVALDHLELKLSNSQCSVIIGKNGSGKSTLLQSIVGLVDIQGELFVDDVKVCQSQFGNIRKKVGFVFQNPDHQLFMNTIYDDLAFGLINQGLPKEEIDSRIYEITKRLHIEHLLQRSCHKLSGGQKRMIAIATVLVMKPDIILMDEPSSFLDPVSRRALIHFIQSLHQTIVIATHDLDMALNIADEVILLNDGKMIAQGQPTDILTNQYLLETNGLELPYCYQR